MPPRLVMLRRRERVLVVTLRLLCVPQTSSCWPPAGRSSTAGSRFTTPGSQRTRRGTPRPSSERPNLSPTTVACKTVAYLTMFLIPRSRRRYRADDLRCVRVHPQIVGSLSVPSLKNQVSLLS